MSSLASIPPPTFHGGAPQTPTSLTVAARQLPGSHRQVVPLATVPEGALLTVVPSPTRNAFDSWVADAEGAAQLEDSTKLGGLDYDMFALDAELPEEAVARRTRAHVSLAGVELDELEALLDGGDEEGAAEEDAQYQQFLEVGSCPRTLEPRESEAQLPTDHPSLSIAT